ncbi:MAG: hypothetical protein RLZZ165_1628 [Bacteroidota bacterium]
MLFSIKKGANKRMNRHLWISAIAITLYAVQLKAQWSADPAVNTAVCTATGSQYGSRIIPDGSGGAIIAWVDTRNGSLDIYAQRINAAGVVQWTANGVGICTAAGEQSTPIITSADGYGRAIIAWVDKRSGTPDIYAQRINAAGVVQWPANGVGICTASEEQYRPIITSDGSGGALIAWSDFRNDTLYSDIYAQRINAAGVVQWTSGGLGISTASGHQEVQRVTSDGSGGAIIVWEDYRSGASDIYAQRINATGVVRWTANGVAICTATADQSYVKMISDGFGGAIIAWDDPRIGTTNYDVYAQRINAAGVVQWTANGVAIGTAADNQRAPNLTSDGSDGAIIAWWDRRSGTNIDIYAQRVNAAGVVQWTANGVATCTAPGDQVSIELTSDGSSGAIIAWEDLRSGNYDIYAQRVNAAGVVQWTVDGTAICTEARNQVVPTLTSDGSGGAIIVFQDIRGENWDIYAQNVCQEGLIGGTVPSTPASISGSDMVCAGDTATYSISAVAGATSYTWTLPPGWTGTSTTASITATAGSSGGNVTVTASNACGASPAASLAVTTCVGTEEPADGAPFLRVLPNPNQGEFTIVSLRKGTFSLYNSLGQEIRAFQFNASTTAVTVTRLENGVYFLVGADRRVAAEKIVVCR